MEDISIDISMFWQIISFVILYLIVMFSIKKIIEWIKKK